MIDDVEVKRVEDLSPRDIEHDNPEFRRLEETVELPASRSTAATITNEDTVTVIRFSQIVERPRAAVRQRRDRRRTTRRPRANGRVQLSDHLVLEAARERVWDAI